MGTFTGTLDATSNRADWTFEVEIIDPTIGPFVDLTGSTIKIAVQPKGSTLPILLGSNVGDGHIVVTGISRFSVSFSPQEMAALVAGYYDVGITALLNTGITHQLLAAQLPVIEGVVNR